MKLIKYFLLFSLIFVFTSCKLFKNKKGFSKSVDTLLIQEPVAIPTDTIEIEPIVQETEPEIVRRETIIGYTSDRYYMIVGSFLSEKLALKYANTLLEMGYQPQVIYSNYVGYYRVSAKSYENFQVAINDIPNYRSSVTNRAWVHVKR